MPDGASPRASDYALVRVSCTSSKSRAALSSVAAIVTLISLDCSTPQTTAENLVAGLEMPDHRARFYAQTLSSLGEPALRELVARGYDDVLRITVFSTILNAEGSWSARYQRRGAVVEFVSSDDERFAADSRPRNVNPHGSRSASRPLDFGLRLSTGNEGTATTAQLAGSK
jgi:hypothetical protein